MNESKLARSLLDRRAAGATVIHSVRKAWKRLSFRIVLIVISLYFYFGVQDSLIFILVIGGVIGATLQDIGWFMGIAKSWKFTASIINWPKVENRANDDS